jgi:iron complex transport system ATP-binding protein
MLELSDISYQQGSLSILRQASCAFQIGKITALVGPNGAGKTSLLKIAAGLVVPDRGAISLGPLSEDGRAAFADRLTRAQQIAYLPQFQPLAWPMACRDIVALGRLPHKSDFAALDGDDEAQIDRAMARCRVTSFADRAIDQLSGGEQARVLMARLLASAPNVYLLDEPIQSLDPSAQLTLMSLMREEADNGKTVVMVLHDLNLAARFCDHVIALQAGAVAFEGTPKQVFTSSNLRPIFNVEMDQVDGPHGMMMQAASGAEDDNSGGSHDAA